MEAAEALAVACKDFKGAVVIASHNRHFLSLACTELLIVDKGTIRSFPRRLGALATPTTAKAAATSTTAAHSAVMSTSSSHRATGGASGGVGKSTDVSIAAAMEAKEAFVALLEEYLEEAAVL